jgi:hypothetical protein
MIAVAIGGARLAVTGGAPCAGSTRAASSAGRAADGDTPNCSRNAAANADGLS